MTSVFLTGALPQVQESTTMRLHRLIDWARIGSTLVGLYKREETRGGSPAPYSPPGMFKLVLAAVSTWCKSKRGKVSAVTERVGLPHEARLLHAAFRFVQQRHKKQE